MEIDLRSFLRTGLDSLRDVLGDSLVYVDRLSADCLSISVGLSYLLEIGSINVHSLEDPSPIDIKQGSLIRATDSPVNIAVFLMEMLGDAFQSLIKLIRINEHCGRVTVFCCYSVDAHSRLESMKYDANPYADYSRRLQEATGKSEIEIRFCPWFFSALTPRSFLLPQPEMNPKGDSEKEKQQLSHALVGLASHLGKKLDVFALGQKAYSLGRSFKTLPPNHDFLEGSEIMKMGVPPGFNETPPEQTAALVLIDRDFDSASAFHTEDSLLDRIITSFPAKNQMQGHDVGVELKSLYSSAQISLFSADPPDLRLLTSHLMGRKTKDGCLYVRKWIKEEIRDAGLQSSYRPKSGLPTKEEFTSGCDVLKSTKMSSKRQAVRAISMLASRALENTSPRLELLISNERHIRSLSSTDEFVQFFLDLIQNTAKPEALVGFQDVCRLLSFAMAVLRDRNMEQFNSTEERLIVEALVQSAMADHNREIVEKLVDQSERKSAVEMKSELRMTLQDRFDLLKIQQQSHAADPTLEFSPKVKDLVSLILQDKKVSGLRHITSTLQGIFDGANPKGILSKGLGRLGFARQEESAISGHDEVIVFVLEGITWPEIVSVSREIDENGRGPWKPKILIGSTSLLTPDLSVYKLWKL